MKLKNNFFTCFFSILILMISPSEGYSEDDNLVEKLTVEALGTKIDEDLKNSKYKITRKVGISGGARGILGTILNTKQQMKDREFKRNLEISLNARRNSLLEFEASLSNMHRFNPVKAPSISFSFLSDEEIEINGENFRKGVFLKDLYTNRHLIQHAFIEINGHEITIGNDELYSSSKAIEFILDTSCYRTNEALRERGKYMGFGSEEFIPENLGIFGEAREYCKITKISKDWFLFPTSNEREMIFFSDTYNKSYVFSFKTSKVQVASIPIEENSKHLVLISLDSPLKATDF